MCAGKNINQIEIEMTKAKGKQDLIDFSVAANQIKNVYLNLFETTNRSKQEFN